MKPEISRRTEVRGIVAVAATYVYFLIFAQFAFLKMLRQHLDATDLRMAMASMAITGLVVSLASAAALRVVDARKLLRLGFLGCATSALVAPICQGPLGLSLVAAWIGATTALLTVTLASSLRTSLSGRHYGLGVGLGTGLAYFLSNLPPLFAASPERQSVVVAVLCLLAVVLVGGSENRTEADLPAGKALRPEDFRGLGFASIVLAFLALVWLDSAAFAIIQETLALKGRTWGDAEGQLTLGCVHLLAAVAAGLLIDRGYFRSLLLAAFALFGIAFQLLQQDLHPLLAGPLYAIGISLYSTALVVYPAYGGEGKGLVPRRFRAALVYGVGGWLGSTLGIGMAQDLHRIPTAFVVLAGLVLTLGWALQSTQFKALAATILRTHGVTLLGGLLGLAIYGGVLPTRTPQAIPSSPEERGRQVYIAEGCISCHSQYVRPGVRDTALFGPHQPIDRTAAPQLIGNRRQGPDLSNVASRRSPTWQRLHLINPRTLRPGSRMPSYPHLFEDDRGKDLVAYLDSLGRENQQAWYEATREVSLEAAAHGGSPAEGRRVFHAWCAPCHGATGRGDGPLSSSLYRPAMNLRKGGLWLVSWGPDSEPQTQGRARLVKYGVPGTDMPGHEYLSDQQLADVVAWVEHLLEHEMETL